MAILVRRWSRHFKLCMLCSSVALFGMSSLLMLTAIQDLNQRILPVRERQDGLNCPSLDDVSVQLMRILGQWESQFEAADQRQETLNNDNGLQLLSLAVQMLTEDGLMAEERNTRRLLYLAEVLHTFKERRSQVERDENATAKIADLVKIFGELTNNRIKEGKNHYKIPPPSHKMNVYNENDLMTWQLFHNDIDQYQLYSKDSPLVDRLLRDIATIPVRGLAELDNDNGSQVKLVFHLEDDSRVLFKPRRLPRDYEESPDLYYMYEFDKHTAEIAAFHLDRILEFRRVPPVAGRYVDMLKDIYEHADKTLRDTFYRSPSQRIFKSTDNYLIA